MKVEELRLGNWVYNDENKPVVIAVIESDKFAEWNGSDSNVMFIEDGHYKYSPVNPIPLTLEIFISCGCVQTDNWEVYILKLSLNDSIHFPEIIGIINIRQGESTGDFGLYFEGKLLSNTFKYLHQFQNLYFALTGKELEIKL